MKHSRLVAKTNTDRESLMKFISTPLKLKRPPSRNDTDVENKRETKGGPKIEVKDTNKMLPFVSQTLKQGDPVSKVKAVPLKSLQDEMPKKKRLFHAPKVQRDTRAEIHEAKCSRFNNGTVSGALFYRVWKQVLASPSAFQDAVLREEYADLIDLTYRFSLCEAKGIEMTREEHEMKDSKLKFCTYDLSTIDMSFHQSPEMAVKAEQLLDQLFVILDTFARLNSGTAVSRLLKALDQVQSGAASFFRSALVNGFKRVEDHDSVSFFHDRTSSLVAALLRYYLRQMFSSLTYEHACLDELGTKSYHKSLKCSPKFIYDFQDFGAAVHFCLNQRYTHHYAFKEYERVDQDYIGTHVLEPHVRESLQHYISSSIFLINLVQVYLSETSNRKLEIEANVSKHSLRLERYNFVDEYHLKPLSSIQDLKTQLLAERDEIQEAARRLSRPRKVKAPVAPKIRSFCNECNEAVTRSSPGGSIKCTVCDGMYHLRCLQLPETFGSFYSQYKCPNCLLF